MSDSLHDKIETKKQRNHLKLQKRKDNPPPAAAGALPKNTDENREPNFKVDFLELLSDTK